MEVHEGYSVQTTHSHKINQGLGKAKFIMFIQRENFNLLARNSVNQLNEYQV